MKTLKVTFIKSTKIVGAKQPVQLSEQNYKTDKEKIDIQVPPGYIIMSVTEYLPDITQMSYDIKPFFHEKAKDSIN